MKSPIEHGMHNAAMIRSDFEIHHSRDRYEDYTFPTNEDGTGVVSLHFHDYYEVFFFLSGEINYQIEGTTYHPTPGDILLIPRHLLHQPVFIRAKGFYERIVLWISPQYLSSLSSEDLSSCLGDEYSGRRMIHLGSTEKEEMIQRMDRLIECRNHNPDYHSTMEQGLLMEVFAILNQIARNGTVSAQAQPISKPVDDVIRYINEHLSEDLPLSLLAETAHFSTQHLLREFKSVMGISIHRYIMAKRLLTAHQYLESGMSASETASCCGFNDYSAFYRAYQKHYHCAPSGSVKSELNS